MKQIFMRTAAAATMCLLAMASTVRYHPRRVSKRQAAFHAGIDRRTLDRLITAGVVIVYRAGPKTFRIDLDELDAALRANNAGDPVTRGPSPRRPLHPDCDDPQLSKRVWAVELGVDECDMPSETYKATAHGRFMPKRLVGAVVRAQR